jgi:hypothetical protein
MTTTSHRVPGTVPGVQRAFQAFAALTVLAIVYQGVTAGQLVSGNESALAQHATGAIVTHVLSGLSMIMAALVWRATRGSVVPVVLAAVVFLVTFAQAYFGSHGPMTVHVPLALIVLGGAVWVLASSLSAPARGR